MSANLTMRQAAQQGPGLSYERFRKVWADLCRLEGFPAPVHGRTWDAGAVAAWRAARSSANVVSLKPKGEAAPVADGRRARQQLQLLRAG